MYSGLVTSKVADAITSWANAWCANPPASSAAAAAMTTRGGQPRPRS
jgi:hypothetical protein